MEQGIFITFEGVDGAGKSTQAQLLATRLQAEGVLTCLTREPGGTALAERIRHLLLYTGEVKLAPVTEILLYAASRAQHVDEVIRPALARGEVVICERYIDSSLAYQGFASGNNIEMIRQVNAYATGGLMPDLTFLLDLETREGWRRVQERGEAARTDRVEAKGFSFQEKVRQGFLRLAAGERERIQLLNCSGRTKDELHQRIWELLLDKFPSVLTRKEQEKGGWL
ncbi:MAG: dTMP kinase [Firmicutes bacterium]|nr:dTMP kinase [Bacillota bacterium]